MLSLLSIYLSIDMHRKMKRKVFVATCSHYHSISICLVNSICLAEKSLGGYYQKHPARFRPTHHWHI